MNKRDELRKAWEDYEWEDESDPMLVAHIIAERCNVSHSRAWDAYMDWMRELDAIMRRRNAPIDMTCHYCGMKATAWGSFDEPVCDDCR